MSTEKVMVSVFVPVYNEDKYISQALDSIIKQKTNFMYEVICHDDASSDKSADILREYEAKYPGVVKVVYQTENKLQKGVLHLFEYVYPIAKGKYIAYCDGDDYWVDERRLQKQVDYLEQNPEYTLCMGGYQLYYDNARKFKKCIISKSDFDVPIDRFIDWTGELQLGTWVFNKELAYTRPQLFQKIGGSQGYHYVSDHPLGIFLATQGKTRYMAEVFHTWRRHINAWGYEQNRSKLNTFLQDKIDFFNELKNICPDECLSSIDRAIDRIKCVLQYTNDNYKACVKSKGFQYLPFKTKVIAYAGCLSSKLPTLIRMIKGGRLS